MHGIVINIHTAITLESLREFCRKMDCEVTELTKGSYLIQSEAQENFFWLGMALHASLTILQLKELYSHPITMQYMPPVPDFPDGGPIHAPGGMFFKSPLHDALPYLNGIWREPHEPLKNDVHRFEQWNQLGQLAREINSGDNRKRFDRLVLGKPIDELAEELKMATAAGGPECTERVTPEAVLQHRYEVNAKAPLKSTIQCATCQKEVEKVNYQTQFCSTKGPGNCKDKYWNIVAPDRRGKKA